MKNDVNPFTPFFHFSLDLPYLLLLKCNEDVDLPAFRLDLADFLIEIHGLTWLKSSQVLKQRGLTLVETSS